MKGDSVNYWLLVAAVLVGAVGIWAWKAMGQSERDRFLGASGIPRVRGLV